MAQEKTTKGGLREGEYYLSDPVLLQEMRLTRDVRLPGSAAILVPKYRPITAKLLGQLERRGIETVFAECIREKSLMPSVQYMENMFRVIRQVVKDVTNAFEEIALTFQYRYDQKTLESLVRNNLNEIQDLFSADPTEKLVALTQHHSGSARHSIIASFHMMALGRELGWSDSRIVTAAVAAFSHDVGKIKVKLETLNWPGRLNHEKWKEIQNHTLFGGMMFYRPGFKPDLLMLSALLHHEWYGAVDGKGYGGLTQFADYFRQSLQLDIVDVVSKLDQNDLEIIQAVALVDMVSALEESRAYKRELDAFKVMIIMNADARLGHFHPKHYAAWHKNYFHQHGTLLPLGRRVALPREKEHRVFIQMPPRKVAPLPLLTYYDIEKLGFLSILQNVGMDVERIRRRGGVVLKIVEQMKQDKGLNFDCSPQVLAAAGITLFKDQIIHEEEFIELDVWREWLTREDLERSKLLPIIKEYQFDLSEIRREGGIAPNRLVKRGIRIVEQKLNALGIMLLKPMTIRLPATESRLVQEDLKKLGISEDKLVKSGCLEKLRQCKNGVPVQWLAERGISFPGLELIKCGIDSVRKIFYDILVTQEISTTRAKFMILREGDDPKELDAANDRNELDPVQDYLLNQIGEVVMDFADLVAMPNLQHIVMGSHWGSQAQHTLRAKSQNPGG